MKKKPAKKQPAKPCAWTERKYKERGYRTLKIRAPEALAVKFDNMAKELGASRATLLEALLGA